MKRCWVIPLFLLLLIVEITNSPIAECKGLTFQNGDSHHDDHLNDESDEIDNDYSPFIIPVGSEKSIIIAPIIACTSYRNETWHSYYYPCKMAQTFFIDNDWHDGKANYTYIFEDWIDYDWNDIIVNVFVSVSGEIFAELLLDFREADWCNPFSLEITPQQTWIKIEWNSTDYPEMNSLIANAGEPTEINLFTESNIGDQAAVRFLIPPIANFDWYPLEPLVGDTVLFNSSKSRDLDGGIDMYSWFLGDNISVNTKNNTITHIFMSPGVHNVTLTVIDNDGLSSKISGSIKISALIGGETISFDNTIGSTWGIANSLVILGLLVLSILMKSKRKKSGLSRNAFPRSDTVESQVVHISKINNHWFNIFLCYS
ncbi:MAG: PKD domain-containing protein [Candidatus Bathyarchaeota archaeon]|nr:MAG: PKD domain-containing protein [Candidatus Bathyarchaeota archaeon]